GQSKQEPSNRKTILERLGRTDRRRQLRNPSPAPEQLLWFALRNRQIEGKKFRRQHTVGRYVLDFYCAEAKLAIEIDGETHSSPTQGRYDDERTNFLSVQGIRVLRFSNQLIMRERASVLEAIRAALT